MDCDLTSDESVNLALQTLRERHGNKLASVVHLAAYYDFSGQPSPLYRKLTVEGTRRLLRGLQNFEVDQFVFSSTHIVMKPSEHGDMITESSPVGADWDYPQSKLDTAKIHQRGARRNSCGDLADRRRLQRGWTHRSHRAADRSHFRKALRELLLPGRSIGRSNVRSP